MGVATRMGRRFPLTFAQRDVEHCLIDAPGETAAFRGDDVDAPVLYCGRYEAELAVGAERRLLTNPIIECKRWGSFNARRICAGDSRPSILALGWAFAVISWLC